MYHITYVHIQRGIILTKIEKKFLSWVQRYYIPLFIIIITILAIWIRYNARNYESTDYKNYLVHWFNEIKYLGGVHALSHQVGDYNITYQFLISLMTYLHIDPLYSYKVISSIFDFALAISSGVLATMVINTDKKARLFSSVYAIVLMLPTVIVNSAYWAQCDSIYSTFVILSLIFLKKDKFIATFACLGLAFAFKLQAIFILPFYIYYYFAQKKYSIFNFLIGVITFYIACLPGILMGRSWLAPFNIYANQQSEYPRMAFHFPNIWSIINRPYDYLSSLAIILTISILGYGLFYILSHHIDLDINYNYIMMLTWSVWSCVMFLPAMHERYGYLVDVLLIICTFIDKRFFSISCLDIFISLAADSIYLFGVKLHIFSLIALLYLGLYVSATYIIFNKLKLQFHNDSEIKII